jgi:lambda family phage portal protein
MYVPTTQPIRSLFRAASVPVSALVPYDFTDSLDTGDKYPGGFGQTRVLTPDYWTLRARSAQLFEQNHYARGLLRRLVTNEINVGLHLEATPQERVLGLEQDALAEWAEDVETRFELWQSDPWLCDHSELRSFGALQQAARLDSLISGDVLVVLRQFQPTALPRVQLISGSAVQSPWGETPRPGSRIVHGVELDAMDRQVAYWVVQRDGTFKRLPAWGEKSGRRLAWLVYGSERRLDDVRGKPVLAPLLQSLREIDRYRDSVQRKAIVNSMLAMFVKKSQDKPGSKPITGGAVRRGTVETGAVGPTGEPRRYNVAEIIPGLVLDELQPGEEPQAFPSHGTDEKFGDFESAIIQSMAWSLEYPPEIIVLSFKSNYSASQAAINELKTALNKTRTTFGEGFCRPIYEEWLLAQVLSKKMKAPGLLEAWRDARAYDSYAAWTSSDWSGNIKPSVDLTKLVTGYDKLVEGGYITRDRASRELTGTKFSQNVKKLRLENEQLVEANKPMLALESTEPSEPPSTDSPDDDIDDGDDESDVDDGKAA